MKILQSVFSYRMIVASDRPKGIYEYTVVGRGRFPTDMLRYDSCWPADTESALAIGDPTPGWNERQVRLRSYSEPTNARWQSFMWSPLTAGR